LWLDWAFPEVLPLGKVLMAMDHRTDSTPLSPAKSAVGVKSGVAPERPKLEVICLPRESQRNSFDRRVRRRLSTWWFRRRFRRFGRGSSIEWPSLLVGCRFADIGESVHVWHSARIEVFADSGDRPALSVGDRTVIGPNVHIGVARRLEIGRECLFASGVYVTDHDHDFSNPEEPVVSNGRVVCSATVIEDRVWLGERVIVLKGVTLGRCSIIGAGSIVTKSIPPYTIAVGAPARVVGRWDQHSRQWVAV
jgi:acetyltransferase-like isoleucine patch superfamily enzyme